ncbi:MAG: MFS transporter [Verrucomicrobiales bacterium]|nr:MFS transporter [Verrucomicrobiales bacterium]
MNPSATQVRRRWMVCGLLLLASAINYMDRQTLASAAVRVTREFQLSQEQYGILESWFGYAFALGSLVFGFLADRFSLRWLYASVVLFWSITGIVTGFTSTYQELLTCRAVLGFVEGGHWPCAVKATRALLEPRDRALGNGVLQSGTSIGAIITPLLMSQLMTSEPGSWRLAFQAVASIGVLWIVAWFGLVRDTDFRANAADASATRAPGVPPPSLLRLIFSRRMLVIFIVIACINTTWQILRAWLPKILQEGRGWTESSALNFNALWFAATDVGCLTAGALVTWLVARGRTLDRARLWVFSGCAALCALCGIVPRLGPGWAAPLVLMIIGAGALGLFPIYHALTQDISGEHQGRITGIASVAAWIAPAQAQRFFGVLADRTGSFDIGFTLAGFLPLLAVLAIAVGWGHTRSAAQPAPGHG